MEFRTDLTPEERARKILKPYLDLEDTVWNQQPYQIRAAYKQIQELEKGGDTAGAKALLRKYPQILNIRSQIATAKKQMRATNPRIRAAYEVIYGKESIWR